MSHMMKMVLDQMKSAPAADSNLVAMTFRIRNNNRMNGELDGLKTVADGFLNRESLLRIGNGKT